MILRLLVWFLSFVISPFALLFCHLVCLLVLEVWFIGVLLLFAFRCLQGEAVQRCMNLMGCSEASKHTIELLLLSDMFSGSLLPIYVIHTKRNRSDCCFIDYL